MDRSSGGGSVPEMPAMPALAAPSRPKVAGADGSVAGGVLAAAPREFLLGDWRVEVRTRRLSRGDETVVLEPRPMAVLVALCRQPGEVVSVEALLQDCWPEATTLGDNPVHKVVAGLRRALGDSAATPRYLETIRKEGYRVVAPLGVLSAQGPRSHAGGWRGQSPFRGLEPFDAAHASVFFGRDEAVAALHARLTRQWRLGHPLVVLLGPSGSGKTSLVQAGLVPALARPPVDEGRGNGGGDVDGDVPRLRVCAAASVDLGALGGLDAWAGLAGAMLDWDCQGVPLLSGHSIDTLSAALREAPDEVLRQLAIGLDATRALRGGAEAPPLLVLDRLEAVLQEDDARTAAWFDALERLVRSARLVVLAVCRNDFYPAMARRPLLMRGKESGAHLDLAPPAASAIAQMIRLPARAAGLSYGTDASGLNRLDDRLCADAMQAPDALPLLQYTLQQLYLHRAPGEVLAWSAYEDLGGLEGAIGRRAEALLGELPADQQEALPRLLPRLVALAGEEASPTGRWVAAAELSDAPERALVAAFVEARLLVADHAGGVNGYRVAHEALLRRWPRVTAWVTQHRAALAARDELRPWVARWREAGQASALLLPRGTTLWNAARILAEAPGLLGEEARDFIARSQRRLRLRRWGLGAASAGAFLLAAVAGVAAIGYARQADVAAERERQSRQLASFMLGELADGLRPIGKLDLLGRIGEQGLRLLGPAEGGETEAELATTATAATVANGADTLARAKALVVIGEVNSSRGKGRTDIAIDALNAALRLLAPLEPLERVPGVSAGDYYRTLGAASFWLGQIAFDAGDFDAAARAMDRYRIASERWRQQAPEDATAQGELGYALNSLGSIAFRRGAWEDAQRWFQASLALKLEALVRSPADADLRDGVATSRTWLGLVAHVRGRPIEALAALDAARAERLAQAAAHPDEQLRLRDLGTLELRRAEALRAAGRLGEAATTMAEGVARLRQAERHDPENRYWRADRQHAEGNLLLARLDAGQAVDAALTALRDQLAGEPATAGSDPARDFLRREALMRVALAEAGTAARAGDWAGVRTRLAATEEAMATLLRLRPHHWQNHELRARRALLGLRADAAGAGPDRARCARQRDQIQPAVDAGQAGLVLEAWLALRACASPQALDDGWTRRLTAGGYVPAHAALFADVPTPSLKGRRPS